MSDAEKCDAFLCSKDAEYIVADDLGVSTPVCGDHSGRFPDGLLELVEFQGGLGE